MTSFARATMWSFWLTLGTPNGLDTTTISSE